MAAKKSKNTTAKKSNTAKFAKKKFSVSPWVVIAMVGIIAILGITLIYNSFAMSTGSSNNWYYNQGRLTQGSMFECLIYKCTSYTQAQVQGGVWSVFGSR